MSSSTAKFVPTLGGRVWRLQRQGVQTTSSVMKSSGWGTTANNTNGTSSSFSSFTQRGAASNSMGQGQGQNQPNSSPWSHRL